MDSYTSEYITCIDDIEENDGKIYAGDLIFL